MVSKILYACLSKDGYIIADYSITEEDFQDNVRQVLSSSKLNKIINISKNGYKYFITSNENYEFVCVINDLVNESIGMEFMELFKNAIEKDSKSKGKTKTSAADLTKIIKKLIVRIFVK